MATPIDPTSVAFLIAENRSMPMHVGGLQLFEKPEGAGRNYTPRDVRGDARRRGDPAALPQAPLPLDPHRRPAGLEGGRPVRHRAPRAAQRAAQARPGPRAARALRPSALHPPGLGAAALGGPRHRGAARRAGGDVLQAPPRPGRRRLRDASAPERAQHRPRQARHARAVGGAARLRPRPKEKPDYQPLRGADDRAAYGDGHHRRGGRDAQRAGQDPHQGRCATRPRRSRSTRHARCSTRRSPAPAASPPRTGRSSGSARSARPPTRR